MWDAGFGWLTRAGVVKKLAERAKGWSEPPLPVTVFDAPAPEDEDMETLAAPEDIEEAHPRSGGLTGWMRSLTSKK
ncbi:MAG: hypothetical protein HQK87_10170 [Nitrospinae bacterium]|nr:hypothetical protein [Nitrospinota bacterium]